MTMQRSTRKNMSGNVPEQSYNEVTDLELDFWGDDMDDANYILEQSEYNSSDYGSTNDDSGNCRGKRSKTAYLFISCKELVFFNLRIKNLYRLCT